MRDRRRQQPRQVVGDVHAADRKLRGVQQLALGEHRHAGGAAAHVDDRGAEFASRPRPASPGPRPTARRPVPRGRGRSARCRRRACAARLEPHRPCAAARSVSSQNRPRGSATPAVSSTVKRAAAHGSPRAHPRRCARAALVHDTARCRPRSTARPPTGHCTLNSRDSGWPQVRLTVTPRSRVSAMSSAWPTAARIARSASSRSTMPPPLHAARRAASRSRARAACRRSRCGRSGRRSWWCRCRARRRRRCVAPRRAACRFVRRSIGGGRRRHLVHPRLAPSASALGAARPGGVGGRRSTSLSGAACRSRPAAGRAARASRCSSASRSSAATSWPSGSSTSVPLSSRRFQRRSPTRTAARMRFCRSGRSAQRVDQRRGGGRRAGADDQRQLAEFGDVLVGDDLAAAVDHDEFAVVLPDGERAALLQDDTMVPGSRRSTVACSTQDRVSSRWRAVCTEKPRIGSPRLTPSAARSSGSGVLARPSISTSLHAQPGAGGDRRRSRPAARRAGHRERPPWSPAPATMSAGDEQRQAGRAQQATPAAQPEPQRGRPARRRF